MKNELKKYFDNIKCPDKIIGAKAQQRLDSLAKPLGSLGELEEIVQKICAIRGSMFPDISKKCIVIMCADNGVTDEGVSSCPKSVTAEVTRNFMRGITGINVFSAFTNSDIVVVDIGVDGDIYDKGILNRKIRKGTDNIAEGPAMTRCEAVMAIEAGIEIANDLYKKGYRLFGTGEMGIGNTTTSSAILGCYLPHRIDELVGKGAGLSPGGYRNKIDVVKRAISINTPNFCDPLDVLHKVGGFDIAGLVGVFIGSAINSVPVVIDGFISGVAALIAIKLEPKVKEYSFPSHSSAESGTKALFELLEMEPMLNLKMRLGEGSGAALGFKIIDAAFEAYTKMGTFDDANIKQYVPL